MLPAHSAFAMLTCCPICRRTLRGRIFDSKNTPHILVESARRACESSAGWARARESVARGCGRSVLRPCSARMWRLGAHTGTHSPSTIKYARASASSSAAASLLEPRRMLGDKTSPKAPWAASSLWWWPRSSVRSVDVASRPTFLLFARLRRSGGGNSKGPDAAALSPILVQPSAPMLERDRRESVDKLNRRLGDTEGAADISVAVGEANAEAAQRGVLRRASSIKAMERQGVAMAALSQPAVGA